SSFPVARLMAARRSSKASLLHLCHEIGLWKPVCTGKMKVLHNPTIIATHLVEFHNRLLLHRHFLYQFGDTAFMIFT
uniref:Uncharacterized protein n=1 Tax=Neolamprologus brichardi TaxID=32507 RepID=A0A3Q4G8C5_NEOBR